YLPAAWHYTKIRHHGYSPRLFRLKQCARCSGAQDKEFRMRRLIVLLWLSVLIPVLLAGCGGDENIREIPYEEIDLVDAQGYALAGVSVEQLYQAGHEYLVIKEPEDALEVFYEVQNRFSFSPYATQAGLESITALYMLGEYDTAVSTADRFIKQHPRHPHIDYVYYLRGLANYRQNDIRMLIIDPDTRDVSHLEQAFDDFRRLIDNFGDSIYANDARMHMIDIRNRLADYELEIAEYYLKRRAWVAATRRASRIIQQYQRSTATPRALELIQRANMHLGLPEVARDARTVLQMSYPQYITHRDDYYRELAENRRGESLPELLEQWLPWERDEDVSKADAWLEDIPSRAVPTRQQRGKEEAEPEEEATEEERTTTEEDRIRNPWFTHTPTRKVGESVSQEKRARRKAEEQAE